MSTFLEITIEDHVVPQLMTSALEAYDHGQHLGRKRESKIETFGLLWGYVIEGRDGQQPRVIATMSTVETSAKRTTEYVSPNFESLRMKREFMRKYWPHIDIVGTFHSHPYNTRDDVLNNKGWEASTPTNSAVPGEGDTVFWPFLHEKICPTTPYLAHLIVTVCELKSSGWAHPKKFQGSSGFEISADHRKFWITSYGSEMMLNNAMMQPEYQMMELLPVLDIPALVHRFM